jgi:excisionase family DNA binding protein
VKRLLTVSDVADLLRLSPWKVRQLVRRGVLPTVPLSRGKLLFHPDALAEAVQRAAERVATLGRTADPWTGRGPHNWLPHPEAMSPPRPDAEGPGAEAGQPCTS